MDSHDPRDFPGLLAGAAVRYHVVRLVRPALLVARHHGVQPWYLDGARYHPYCDLRHDYAVARWGAVGRCGFQLEG